MRTKDEASEMTPALDKRDPTLGGPCAGRIYYDADCDICTGLVRRFEQTLIRRGFTLHPLQEPDAAGRLAIPESELLHEMRVLTPAGRVYGGADAVLYLAHRIGWAWPLAAVAGLPGGKRLARFVYEWVAARRGCPGGACRPDGRPR